MATTTALDGGGIQVDVDVGVGVGVDVARLLLWPAQERQHPLVDLLTDPAHLQLVDAALGAKGSR
jgi:hypothetical protein